MNFFRDFLKKLKDPFKLLAIFSLFFGISSRVTTGLWQSLLGATFATSLILLILAMIIRFGEWYSFRLGVRFYRNWHESPRKYRVEETIQYLSERNLHLEIIGRTCFRWLCGDENIFESNKLAFLENLKLQQDRLCRAVRDGSTIHFIIQNPNISVPFFNEEDNQRLRQHAHAAIASYETINSKLAEVDKQKVKLSFTNEVIENSMSRLMEGEYIIRLIFDLSIKFKSPNVPLEKISKPFLVFESNKSGIDEFREEFDFILSKSIPKTVFDNSARQGYEKVNSIISSYPHYSKLRGDECRKMAPVAARHFLAENNSPIVEKTPPPLSIQLLVTNQCTTQCKMCDHYKLFNPIDELDYEELKCTFDCIKDMGTNSVILSGGEPLARRELFDLLVYGKSIGISIGLLTNGVRRGGRSINSEEAKIISDTCSWIQMSIDSFDENIYTTIRGNQPLKTALNSLNEIVSTGYSNIEICFTIQKDNITEIPSISTRIRELIPPSVPIRFKFAHGPSNGREYLCSETELRNAIRKFPKNDRRTNLDYLLSMISNEYFDYEGLSLGVPLKKTMVRFRSKGYTCQALRLSCKIDANGDIYPCCFLFDDNLASSDIRGRSRIGSVRSSPSGRVTSPLIGKLDNALSMAWQDSEVRKHYIHSILPVTPEACSACTRHFYQNEYLNELFKVFNEFRYYGIAEKLVTEDKNSSASCIWV